MFSKKYLAFVIVSLVIMTVFAACNGKTSEGTDIKEITWKWASLSETLPASISLVPSPENFTLTLGSDETLNIKADCNMVGGSYTMEGSALSMTLGASTMAYCGEESLDQLFLVSLGQVESFSLVNGELVLQLAGDAGSMQFVK